MAKKIVGVVSSDVRDKTITITVTRRETHPIYRKQYTVTRKFTAHDEKNEAHKGDRVEIVEVRPISKTKSWSLSRIVETGHGEIELKEEPAIVAEKQVVEKALEDK
jgi:small subunit ribosomal protein S17